MNLEFTHIPEGDLFGFTQCILDTMHEALVILDDDLCVKAVNPAFHQIFQLDEAETIGRPLFSLSDGQWKGPALEAGLADLLLAKGGFKDIEVQIEVGSERTKTVLVNARRLDLDGAASPPTYLLVAQDITDQEQTRQELEALQEGLEQRVRRRTEELASANAELEAFAYSVSHDLRTPLRAVAGFSRALSEDCADVLDEEGQRYLNHIQNGAQRMSTLIDDLLELSRVTRREMRYADVNLSDIAGSIVEDLFEVEPDRTVDVTIEERMEAYGDKKLLTIVLRSLIENAWKYTVKEEHPRVEIGRERGDEETVYFVKDNGVGFDMKYADKLFQPFQRLHSVSEFEGTGIGLATAYRILRRHGGRIWCDAQVSQGATFYFTIRSDEGEKISTPRTEFLRT